MFLLFSIVGIFVQRTGMADVRQQTNLHVLTHTFSCLPVEHTQLCMPPFVDWYFAIALERGWFGWHTYYCSSRWKDGNASSAVDCSETAVPYTSLFTFLAAGGAKVKVSSTHSRDVKLELESLD